MSNNLAVPMDLDDLPETNKVSKTERANTSPVDLNDLLAGKSAALDSVYEDLTKQGWSIVKLDTTLLSIIESTIEPLQSFFSKSKDYKKKYEWPTIFGYTEVPHRESLRLLTSQRYSEFTPPPECATEITKLVKAVDEIMYTLAKATSHRFFQTDVETLGTKYDLPMLKSKSSVPKFGMLDAAHYYNEKPLKKLSPNEPDLNCASHYDPGLLSLSFLSTAPGLELLNSEDIWVPAPDQTTARDLAVIWAGKAGSVASRKAIKPGLHRVVFGQKGVPRLAIWHEICTSSQEPNKEEMELEVLKLNQPVQQQKASPRFFIKNIFSSAGSTNSKNKKVTNKRNSNSNSNSNSNVIRSAKPAETTGQYLKHVERKHGVPRSKSKPSSVFISRRPVGSEVNEGPLLFKKRVEGDFGVPMSKSGL